MFLKLKQKLIQRDFSLEVKQVEKEERTLTFPFSSEQPVTRYFGDEVLEHKSDNWDLSRLNDGGPLLFNHSFDRPIGVVNKAWIDESDNVDLSPGCATKEKILCPGCA